MKPSDQSQITERDSLSGIPLRRIIMWIVVALAILLGLVLFFRFGSRVAPIIGLLA